MDRRESVRNWIIGTRRNQMKKTIPCALTVVLVTTMLVSAMLSNGQSQYGQQVYTLPPFGSTVWEILPGRTNFTLASPLPFFLYDPNDVPLYQIDSSTFVYERPDAVDSSLTGGLMDNSSMGGGSG